MVIPPLSSSMNILLLFRLTIEIQLVLHMIMYLENAENTSTMTPPPPVAQRMNSIGMVHDPRTVLLHHCFSGTQPAVGDWP